MNAHTDFIMQTKKGLIFMNQQLEMHEKTQIELEINLPNNNKNTERRKSDCALKNLNLFVLSSGLLAKGSSAAADRLCEQQTMNISPQAIPRCLIQETLWTHALWAPAVHHIA